MRGGVTVLGCGKWGTAFGGAIAEQCRVVFWSRNPAAATAAAAVSGAIAREDLEIALKDADLVVVAVSSGAFVDILSRVVRVGAFPVAWLTKGFDPVTHDPLCHAAATILGESGRYAAISGPSFADDVAAGKPTALTLCANRREEGERMRHLLHSQRLRFYLEDDMVALCVGGAVKNVIAVAAGASDAMGLGESARAALVTRGLAEMAAICEALGGRRESLLGLGGIGDLMLTCGSDLSRNRRLGLLLGAASQHVHTAADLARLLPGTCESVSSIAAVLHCVERFALSAPIIRATAAVLQGRSSPAQALSDLLSRPPRNA